MNLNELAQDIHQNAVKHGWWEEKRSIGEIIALCHSELSEALEEARNGEANEYFLQTVKNGVIHQTDMSQYDTEKLEGVAVEMADCIIRILDWCGKENIDIQGIIERKHEYNQTRPFKHGGKKF